jgi:hypothetical protein
MKKLRIIIAGVILILGLIFMLHAQETATPVQPATPDSIVQVMAEGRGLSLVAPADLPDAGTFWMVDTNGVLCPNPCPPPNAASLPVYGIADGEFLVDATGGQVATAPDQSITDALTALADAVGGLISQVQASAQTQKATPSRMMSLDDLDGGGFTPAFSIPTNSLWLQITNVGNGQAYFNLMNATDEVYEIWSKEDLTSTNWSIENEVFPSDTNCMPFTVEEQDRTNLFLWARDWTGVTSHGNTTPEWWFWKYFSMVDLSDTNLDSDGSTLLYDYQNGLDPNVIQFSLSVTNQYINNMSAPVQLNVTKGVPSYFAVLVDDTNFTDATWNTYTSSNITVYLGLVQGWHDVWVGLRGLPSNAAQTWQWKHLNLTLPPVLAITNPVTGIVDEPMIQIYGYCQDSLASISYDISNAVGVVTNQSSEITDQYYDTNAFGFTTNYFECLDVPLAIGSNTIVIHATDLAGDTTTTNFNFTLDYSSKTNPPIVQITWPTNGTQISGSAFTCRGWTGDPTATVSAQLVFPTGNTNIYSGEVERNGNFWLENVPIDAGTNTFAITIRDAVGNTNTTNINVVESTLTLTIEPFTATSQLWQATVNLGGTISDPTYAIWVNGVKGHNNSDGTWSANNVPVNSGGTASFTATAYAPSEQQPDGSYGN